MKRIATLGIPLFCVTALLYFGVTHASEATKAKKDTVTIKQRTFLTSWQDYYAEYEVTVEGPTEVFLLWYWEPDHLGRASRVSLEEGINIVRIGQFVDLNLGGRTTFFLFCEHEETDREMAVELHDAAVIREHEQKEWNSVLPMGGYQSLLKEPVVLPVGETLSLVSAQSKDGQPTACKIDLISE